MMKIRERGPRSFWRFTIKGPDGKVKYESPLTGNITVTEGLLYFSDTYYSGSSYTAAWYIGICGPGAVTPDVGDTAAKITDAVPNPPTTNDWQEITAYVSAVRAAVTWADPALESDIPTIHGGTVSFVMTAPGVLQGGILITDSTKGGTSGVLFAVDSGGGAATYGSGDTIDVAVTVTLPGGVS